MAGPSKSKHLAHEVLFDSSTVQRLDAAVDFVPTRHSAVCSTVAASIFGGGGGVEKLDRKSRLLFLDDQVREYARHKMAGVGRCPRHRRGTILVSIYGVRAPAERRDEMVHQDCFGARHSQSDRVAVRRNPSALLHADGPFTVNKSGQIGKVGLGNISEWVRRSLATASDRYASTKAVCGHDSFGAAVASTKPRDAAFFGLRRSNNRPSAKSLAGYVGCPFATVTATSEAGPPAQVGCDDVSFSAAVASAPSPSLLAASRCKHVKNHPPPIAMPRRDSLMVSHA